MPEREPPVAPETPPQPQRVTPGVSSTERTPTGPVKVPAEAHSSPVPPTESTLRIKLLPIAAIRLEGSGYTFEVAQPGEHSLGRAVDAVLRITSPRVSRRHARIVLDAERRMALVEDAGGAGGTMLNGKRIESALLSDGDEIEIGDVRMRVTLRRA